MKIINEITYKLIFTCQNYGLNYLKTFFKEELELSYEPDNSMIYNYLLEAVFEINDKETIKKIFANDLYNLYLNNYYTNFNYDDLCNLLFKNLCNFKINDKENIIINVNGTLIPYNDYLEKTSYIYNRKNSK